MGKPEVSEDVSENLREIVKRVMCQKGLSPRDVQERASKKGQIAASYISRIYNGKAGNLTFDKIVGLAKGLGVKPIELFVRMLGQTPTAESELDARTLLNLMQKVVDNPRLLDILRLSEELSPTGQEVLINSLRHVHKRSEPKQKPRKRRKKRS